MERAGGFTPGAFGVPSPFAGGSPRRTAKIAGVFYLTYIAATILASYLRSTLIVGDAASTAANIVASPLVLRIALVVDLVSGVLFLLTAWALYVLLKPVNENYALLFLLLKLGGGVIQCANALSLSAALQTLSNPNYASAFSTAQLQAMAMSFLDLYTSGFVIAQIFFSAWLLPLGYLVYKSRCLPKFLGLLLILHFFGNLSWFLVFFLLPGFGVWAYPGNAISFIAEISLMLWLLIMGVKEPK